MARQLSASMSHCQLLRNKALDEGYETDVSNFDAISASSASEQTVLSASPTSSVRYHADNEDEAVQSRLAAINTEHKARMKGLRAHQIATTKAAATTLLDLTPALATFTKADSTMSEKQLVAAYDAERGNGFTNLAAITRVNISTPTPSTPEPAKAIESTRLLAINIATSGEGLVERLEHLSREQARQRQAQVDRARELVELGYYEQSSVLTAQLRKMDRDHCRARQALYNNLDNKRSTKSSRVDNWLDTTATHARKPANSKRS